MTDAQHFAEGRGPRLLSRAGRQRISRRALATLMPWSARVLHARIRSQVETLDDYIGRGDSVLDVGCWDGFLAKTLKQRYGAELTGVDVQDFDLGDVAFRRFDGLSIPFPDRTFDHVILSFVLHHSHEPMTLARECRRVARRSVIIFEDLPESRFGRMLVSIHVGLFKRAYGLKAKGGDYRSALAWLGDNAANVVQTLLPDEWFDVLYRVPHYLLVYELPND